MKVENTRSRAPVHRQTGLELWFKGGTSLSKGYDVIQRCSEDLDLMVLRGAVAGLPAVSNWTSANKGPIAARRAFYEAFPGAFVIPAVTVEIDAKAQDE